MALFTDIDRCCNPEDHSLLSFTLSHLLSVTLHCLGVNLGTFHNTCCRNCKHGSSGFFEKLCVFAVDVMRGPQLSINALRSLFALGPLPWASNYLRTDCWKPFSRQHGLNVVRFCITTRIRCAMLGSSGRSYGGRLLWQSPQCIGDDGKLRFIDIQATE